MARAPEQIERDYGDTMERAKRWEDTEPEKARQMERDAADARANAYRERSEASDAEARTATLANAKGEIMRKYPRADPSAVRGDTTEAMEAAAKQSHEFVEAQIKAEQEAARGARRAETRNAWTGSDRGTRPGMPGGELAQAAPAQKEVVEAAYKRTAEIIQNANTPGHLRSYSPDNTQAVPPAADPEMRAWQDYKILHANSGLTFEAFQARNAGRGSFVENNPGVNDEEDKRG